MSIGIVLSIGLAGIVAWRLSRSFLAVEAAWGGASSVSGDRQTLLDQKARCLQVLSDLELDHATGKIGPSDYAQTKTRLSVELAAILERIDAHRSA